MLLGACVKPQPLNYLLCTTKLRVFTTLLILFSAAVATPTTTVTKSSCCFFYRRHFHDSHPESDPECFNPASSNLIFDLNCSPPPGAALLGTAPAVTALPASLEQMLLYNRWHESSSCSSWPNASFRGPRGVNSKTCEDCLWPWA